MMVERFHLNRLWSYKAIRQQIQILSDKLMRIRKEYDKLIEEIGEGRQSRQFVQSDGDEHLLSPDTEEYYNLTAEEKEKYNP